MLLGRFFDRLIQVGTLTLVDVGGRARVFGNGDGPAVTVRLHNRKTQYRLPVDPSLTFGEGYTDGSLTVEGGTIYDVLDLIGRNIAADWRFPVTRFEAVAGRLLRPLHTFNPRHRARANVAHHYDLSGALYEIFLDADMHYSCAYFTGDHDDLERAQLEKKHHIAAKLLLEPGDRVLDIGSGWGGLALHLAAEGVDVTGLTLSSEQQKAAEARARDAGLADRARFFLRDYREQTGTFERIVSVGMFEHVGVRQFRTFFDTVYRLLSDDGVALLHTIGRAESPGSTDPWIRKYIFPGGYIPALSEVMPTIEKTGLWVTDIEVLRLHYARTLRHWRTRFQTNRAAVAELYDERFCRMWEYYLAASEASFRYLRNVVFQIQLAKRQDAVPLTRDYVTDYQRSGAKVGNGRHAA